MSLIALAAAKSAGVTTSALALAGVWPGPVLLAECDPAGGDINAGLLRGAQPAGALLDLGLATRRGLTPAQFWDHTVALSDDGTVRLLPGLADPAQHPALTSAWPLLIRMLQAIESPPPTGSAESDAAAEWDVLADCGRLSPATPMGLLGAADLVLLVLRPRLAHVAHTRSRLLALRSQIADHADGPPPELKLLLVGTSPYPAAEVAIALDLPVAGVLADDPPAAAVLAGLAGHRSRFERSPLMRTAHRVAADLHHAVHAVHANLQSAADDQEPSEGDIAAEPVLAERP